LRDVQLLSGGREGTAFGDGLDDLELPEIHALSGYICQTHGFNGTDVSGLFQSSGERTKVVADTIGRRRPKAQDAWAERVVGRGSTSRSGIV
jgi:hypothetical protein